MAIYRLKTPKQVDGKIIVEIDVPELELDQVIELSELDSNDLRAMKAFLAKAVGVSETIIGRLSLPDFQGVIATATGPLDQPRGEALSASPPTSRRSTKRASSSSES